MLLAHATDHSVDHMIDQQLLGNLNYITTLLRLARHSKAG